MRRPRLFAVALIAAASLGGTSGGAASRGAAANVYVLQSDGTVLRIDVPARRIVWTRVVPGAADAYGHQGLALVGGNVYVAAGSEAVVVLDAGSGAEVARLPAPPGFTASGRSTLLTAAGGLRAATACGQVIAVAGDGTIILGGSQSGYGVNVEGFVEGVSQEGRLRWRIRTRAYPTALATG